MVIYLCGLAAAGRFINWCTDHVSFIYFTLLLLLHPSCAQGRLYLSAETAKEMNEWISQIRSAMSALRNGQKAQPPKSSKQPADVSTTTTCSTEVSAFSSLIFFFLPSYTLECIVESREKTSENRHTSPPPQKKNPIRKETRKVKTNKKQKQCCCAAVQSELWTPCAGQMGEGMGGWRDEGRLACTRDFLFPPWRTHSLE